MKNYPFKRSTLLAGRLIGSSRGVFLLSSLVGAPFSLLKTSRGLLARAFVYSSRKHGAMRARGGGTRRSARRNGRETKEDFIFGGPMTLKGASVEEEEERPVERSG